MTLTFDPGGVDPEETLATLLSLSPETLLVGDEERARSAASNTDTIPDVSTRCRDWIAPGADFAADRDAWVSGTCS